MHLHCATHLDYPLDPGRRLHLNIQNKNIHQQQIHIYMYINTLSHYVHNFVEANFYGLRENCISVNM
jgi:hypothetical protein